MVYCGTLTTTFTTGLHRLAASKTGHGYQEHQEQKNSPLINHGLNLLMTLTASATSLTAYRATQLRFILTALTGFSFHFLCTFVWSSCQVSNGRQHSDKHYVGVWMSSFIKPLSSGARKKIIYVKDKSLWWTNTLYWEGEVCWKSPFS